METETEDGGYPPSPVIYTVTKVDNELNSIGETVTVPGDSQSKATLGDLKTGKYIVEQKEIPSGYIKDVRQVVNISRTEDGYALFVIEKPTHEEFENTEVKITKQILNKQGFEASSEDFKKAKLKEDGPHSFEVKIQEVNTKETYYAFIDEQKETTIKGLPYGTYEIEEVYKPKYNFKEMTGNFLNKDESTNKYTFTFNEEAPETQNKVKIVVKNVIDDEFGFGGQDFKDNLSKEVYEAEEIEMVTRVKIYVRDDQGKKVSDAKFKLYDKNNNVIKFVGVNGTYVPSKDDGEEEIVPVNGMIVIKSLETGDYRLENTEISDSYLLSNDREVNVYKSAVGITRVEVLRNIPRGSLTLSTVYNGDDEREGYAPYAKYKIIDTEADEVLTFIKKADGTYARSNLPNASEYIVVKVGEMELTGIEAEKDYQIGLVYTLDEYGVVGEPQTITVKEGQSQEVKTEVEKRANKFVKVLTPGSGCKVYALNANGDIWYGTGDYGSGSYKMNKVENKTKFVDIECWYERPIGIDKDGKVYIDLSDTSINDVENSEVKDIRFKQVAANQASSGYSIYLLDKEGIIWQYGSNSISQDSSNPWFTKTSAYTNMNDIINNLYDDVQNIIFTYVATQGYNQTVAIDNKGKVWTWGNNYLSSCGLPYKDGETYINYTKPICISDIENSNIKNIKMKKAVCGYTCTFLIDENNDLWSFGSSNYGQLGNLEKLETSSSSDNPIYWNPICITKQDGNPLKGTKIVDIACDYETISAVDERGNLWTWGYEGDSGILGYGRGIQYDENNKYNSNKKNWVSTPVCISALDNNKLSETKLVQVSNPYYNVAGAIDEDGNIWLWGDQGPFGYYSSNPIPPTRFKYNTKAYYEIPKFVKVAAGDNHSVAIDADGRVWAWGYNGNANLGIGNTNGNSNIPVCVGGNNSEITNHKIVDIAAGYGHTLAIDENGDLWSWGYGSDGQCGITYDQNGKDSYIREPKCITQLNVSGNKLYGKTIKKIDTTYEASAIIDSEGNLYTCGYNSYGLLGNGTTNNGVYCVNEGLPNDVKFIDVSVGYQTILALDSEGRIWTAGGNAYGNLGRSENFGTSGNDNYVKTFKCITTEENNRLYNKKIKKIASGDYHSLVIDENDNVWTWGNGSNNLLLNNTNSNSYNATNITDKLAKQGIKVVDIYAGEYVSMVVDESGKIWTWGTSANNITGQINYEQGKIKCINDSNNLNIKNLSLGRYHALVIDNNNDIWSWGSSSNNKTGFTENVAKPTKIRGKTEYKVLNTNYERKYENLNDYTSVSGVIGNTTTPAVKLPFNTSEVKTKYTYTDITMYILKDGRVYTYGNNNSYGILGTGDTEARKEPVLISDKFNNKQIDSVVYTSNTLMIVKDTDNGYWAWGDNNYGQCGTGSLSEESIKEPNFLGTFKQFITITTAEAYMAVDNEDYLYVWGRNSNDKLGIANSGIVAGPTKVLEEKFDSFIQTPSNSTWSYTLVLTKEQNLYYWGYDQLNYDSKNNYIQSPIKINEGFSVDSILYKSTTCFVKDTDGYLWSFGSNNLGQCGNGETSAYTKPKKVGKYDIQELRNNGNNTYLLLEKNGKLWTWGQNYSGQCGIGDTSQRYVYSPTEVKLTASTTVNKIVLCTNYGTIVEDNLGRLWSWGSNTYGKLGTGDNNNVIRPVCISIGDFANVKLDKVINQTLYIIMIKDTDGKIWTWGQNTSGACGVDSTESYTRPKCINSMEGYENFTVKSVSLSGTKIIITDENNQQWVWGCTYASVNLDGGSEYIRKPMKPGKAETPQYDFTIKTYIYNGTNTKIIRDTEDKVWAYGTNTDGLCGTGDKNAVTEPICLSDKYNFKVYSSVTRTINGKIAIYIVDKDGELWTWGANAYTVVDGKEVESLTPICITKDNNIEYKSMIGSSGSIMIKDKSDNLWKFGISGAGQKAEGESLLPVNITSETTMTASSYTNYALIGTYAYFTNSNTGDFWICGNVFGTKVIKLNTLKEFKNTKIKQIGYSATEDRIYVLTEEGKIYYLKVESSKVKAVLIGEDMYESEYTIDGAWENKFLEIKNMKY